MRIMKHAGVFAAIVLVMGNAHAGSAEYNDCILEHLKGAKLDAVAGILRDACYENYMGLFSPPERVRAYNECLLEHLVGVESFQAAMTLRSACSVKYLR